MDCLNNNCNITGADRMVSCWLCLGNYHLKCTGLKARDADAIADPAKSLQWTCHHCKKINIDFYKFFKTYKDEFEQLNKDFLSVQNKLLKFGELFTKFQSLDKFTEMQDPSQPKRRKTANKSPAIPEITCSLISTNLNSGKNNDAVADLSPSPNSIPLQQFNAPSPAAGTSNRPLNSILPTTTPIDHNRMPLRAIPPKKSVFISRLASGTSVDDVQYYINSKLGRNVSISLHQFKFSQPRSITSFKITVAADLFETFIDPSFWPENTLVREYIYNGNPRVNNVAVLPQHQLIQSKN